MVDDMTMRKLSLKTQSAYLRAVRGFACYLRRPPDTATAEELRSYQLYLVERGISSGDLQFFGEYASLVDAAVFADWMKPLRACEWVVYAKKPFAGPTAVLAYLSRYTHRVAISNQRLVSMDERGITFRWSKSMPGSRIYFGYSRSGAGHAGQTRKVG